MTHTWAARPDSSRMLVELKLKGTSQKVAHLSCSHLTCCLRFLLCSALAFMDDEVQPVNWNNLSSPLSNFCCGVYHNNRNQTKAVKNEKQCSTLLYILVIIRAYVLESNILINDELRVEADKAHMPDELAKPQVRKAVICTIAPWPRGAWNWTPKMTTADVRPRAKSRTPQ